MIDISKGRYWDFGWQLIEGCTPCSPGCDNCWALAMEKRFKLNPGNNIYTHYERLNVPLKRKKPAVYAIWNDLFHEYVPDSFQESVFHIIRHNKQHVFLILTKRPENMQKFTRWVGEINLVWPDNAYLGLTVCNQQEADEKIPVFLKVPGKKFLSLEPLLEEIDLRWTYDEMNYRGDGVHQIERIPFGIDAVILGGETLGPRPGREMRIEWVESIVSQCEQASVPLFIKQLHINGKVSKDMNEWPEHLRRRELPWLKEMI